MHLRRMHTGGEMKMRVILTMAAAMIAAFILIQCGTPATPPPPVVQTVVVTVKETVSVPQTVVAAQTVAVPQTVVAAQTVVVEPTAAPPSGVVKVLLVGRQDEDGVDPITGKTLPGIKHLEEA